MVFTLRLLLSGGEEAPGPEKAVVAHETSSPGDELGTKSPADGVKTASDAAGSNNTVQSEATVPRTSAASPPTSNSADGGSAPGAVNQSETSDPANRTTQKAADETANPTTEPVPAAAATANHPAAQHASDSTDKGQNRDNSTTTPPPLPAPTVDATTTADTTAPAAASPDVPPTTPAPGEPQPAAGTLKRVAPRTVNLNARLAESVPKIDVEGQSLDDFLEMISAMSTVPITLDADAVHDLGQVVTAKVQLHLTDAGVAEILQTALEPLRLGYQVRDRQLVVGYPPQGKLRQVRYAVKDLVSGDTQALGDLASLVRQMVAPASWQQLGGKATMVAGDDALLVEQTEPAHTQILNLCEKLRVARGLPVKSHYDPARFVLKSRQDKADEMLAKPMSANFSAPTPLAEVVKWLRQATGATILIDHAALAAEGMSDDSECTALAVNQPLAKLLDDLTASADLTWRAIDEHTIEITSPEAALERMDVEFYPVGDLVKSATAEKLISQIKGKVEPQLWTEASDKPGKQGAIVLDKPSGTLIVRAPQRVQTQVEAELASQRGRK